MLTNPLLIKALKKYRFSRLTKELLSKIGRSSSLNGKKWIFIIGCYNSGTTLLDKILSNHPQISGLNDEGVIFTGYLSRPEDFGWTRNWSMCYDKVMLSGDEENQNIAVRVKKHWSNFYDTGKTYLLEKSIVNTTRLLFLQRYFQPAYFIYIVRNGYAVSEGIRRKAKPANYGNKEFPNGYPIDICAKQWVRTHEVVEKDKAVCNRFISITYEDLVDKTEATLKTLTDFLSIESFGSSTTENSYAVHGVESKIINHNASAISLLTVDDLNQIDQVAGNVLTYYGYERI